MGALVTEYGIYKIHIHLKFPIHLLSQFRKKLQIPEIKRIVKIVGVYSKHISMIFIYDSHSKLKFLKNLDFPLLTWNS